MPGSLRDSLRQLLHKFREDQAYRELVMSSFFSLLVRILGVGTGFLVTLFTSRYFGAGALGIVSICIALLSFSAVIAKLGLDVALMRDISAFHLREDLPSIKGTYITALKLIVPFSLFLSLVLYFTAGWMARDIFHKEYLAPVLRINAWFILPLVLLMINSESVRALKKIRSYTFYQTAAISTIAVVLLFIFRFINVEKHVPVYIQFASMFMAGMLTLVSWFRYSRFTSVKALYPVSASGLLRNASPMFMTTLMQLLMSWAAILILAAWVPEDQVGIFNAMIRISVFTNITILAVNSLAMPRFAGAFASGNTGELKRDAQESARLVFLTSLPIFVALVCFPKLILSVFGKEFPGHEASLLVLLAGQFIAVFAGLPSQILNMTNQQKALRNIAMISAVVNVGSCLLLIPSYGLFGASLAQLFGTFSWNLLCVMVVRKQFGFFTFFTFKR